MEILSGISMPNMVNTTYGEYDVYCPDEGGELVLEGVDTEHFIFEFRSATQRNRCLEQAKKHIAAWCNDHPGVYGAVEHPLDTLD